MNFCLSSIQGWQYVVIIKLDFLTLKQSIITFASQSTISLIPILSSRLATYDHELPATATENIIATHLGDFDVPTRLAQS
jgi:hypothetical protein